VLDYERGRTAWPVEVTDGIEADRMLDLAAGTGKLTRVLVERFREVITVELSCFTNVGSVSGSFDLRI
jgi:ubiquinone/menaquinone biosynthesis C-methylase UbiE